MRVFIFFVSKLVMTESVVSSLAIEIYKEPIYYQNPALCMKVWQFTVEGTSKRRDNFWHYHKEIELIFVQKGIHELRTPNHDYLLNPGDVLILGSSQLHAGHKIGEEDLVYMVLHIDLQPYFDPAMMMYVRHFMEVQQPLEVLNYMFQENDVVRREVASIILQLHEEVMGKAKGYEIAVSMHIKHLLLTLLRHDRRELLQAHEYMDTDVIRPIMDYVDAHLCAKIDMEQVSHIAGMSYTYFSKYFKKKMGSSFTEYVNRKRISKAERLLVTEKQSITEIAASVGIENMAHFYELFKRYNACTPKQYLSKIHNLTGLEPS